MRKSRNISLVITLAFAIFIATTTSAQTNLGFEKGLTGWIAKGKPGNVSMDKTNAHGGNNCVKIGAGQGEVFQRMPVAQLSVLSFNIFVKTSDSTISARAFVRFFDANHKLLLTYTSAPVKSQVYQSTGNYTETPALTKYMEIGTRRYSSAEGAVYVDDLTIETNAGEAKIKHANMVNERQYMQRFWKSDTIYDEAVLLFSENGKAAEGKLLYTPSKLLSIKKFDLSTTYKQDGDYSLSGRVITRFQNSPMPFRADTSFDTKKDLAWYNLQSQWVLVTYTHDDKWDRPVPVYKGNKVPRVVAKLKAKQPVKIIALGMSITRGMNVSAYDDVAPYMPTYVDLFANQLKRAYHNSNVRLYNAGLPGAIVDWGALYADKYINPLKPDLVILDFGMNDFWRYTPEQFKGYIETIIKKVKAGCPKAEFLLLLNTKFDPDYVLDSDKNKEWYLANMEGYSKVLAKMETDGIINLNMTEISDAIYHHKKAKDCLANPLHPNDYMARWYAQGLAQLLIK